MGSVRTDDHTTSPATPRQIAARPIVRFWLWSVALCVFAMVIVGGATRLTESGLAITEWAPVTGAIPPLSQSDWVEAFEKYRQIPQYQQLNKGMSLDEFKSIYWWEWAHRFLGRFIGVLFFVPFVWFLATRRVERRLVPWLWGAFVLGGLQGALGWYMVASGLVDRVSVSQYRLAAHLVLASAIFAYLLWITEGIRDRSPEAASPRRLRTTAVAIVALIFLQIVLGGLVAGLDAGLTYQTWPLMDGRFVPEGLLMQTPWWLNAFENITTVQFDHRMVAYVLVLATIWHAVDASRNGGQGPAAARAVYLAGLTLGQAGLGIATLVLGMPLWLALAHQAGAMVVLATAVLHAYALHHPTGAPEPRPGALAEARPLENIPG
ncbi:COX15/CtaA family protein [Microbaculum marinum]|uniref:Heme A synthase n=1 Tax=Microbaculum marinum TaxID=1764581 RepID=A0AAW9RXV8_9HYPH